MQLSPGDFILGLVSLLAVFVILTSIHKLQDINLATDVNVIAIIVISVDV